ncbi:type IV pilin N-terminal domain-containing protein [Haloglomus litoreum]|uniref:type IV pilin N-terminal domain-containing protein n=1 Tax=Haloglomus litoreum TaxID=3034026 RepID=UPI003075B951
MEFTNLLGDDDAVSPVIGVILMVAITVILAAVIGTFVLGLGDQVSDTSPQASFTFDLTDNAPGTADSLTITHDGGDKIAASQISFASTGAIGTDSNPQTGVPYDAKIRPDSDTWEEEAGSGDVSAGSAATLAGDDFQQASAADNANDLDGDSDQSVNVDSADEPTGSKEIDSLQLNGATIRVTWSSSNGGDTATLGKWTGPDA